jgi:hypothetical protein
MKPWNAWVGWLACTGLCLGVAAWSRAAAGESEEEWLTVLKAAAGNRGPTKLYADPVAAAAVFLAALERKDLNRMAQATALRAATESLNQELFFLILAQRLTRAELDELAEKLAGFRIAGTSAVARNTVKILVTKPVGNSAVRRMLTMREEKAGWKLLDLSGEGELAKPIFVPRKDRGGNRL